MILIEFKVNQVSFVQVIGRLLHSLLVSVYAIGGGGFIAMKLPCFRCKHNCSMQPTNKPATLEFVTKNGVGRAQTIAIVLFDSLVFLGNLDVARSVLLDDVGLQRKWLLLEELNATAALLSTLQARIASLPFRRSVASISSLSRISDHDLLEGRGPVILVVVTRENGHHFLALDEGRHQTRVHGLTLDHLTLVSNAIKMLSVTRRDHTHIPSKHPLLRRDVHKRNAGLLAALLLLQSARSLVIPVDCLVSNAAKTGNSQTGVLLRVEEPQVHHNLVLIPRRVHGNHVRAGSGNRLRTQLRVAMRVRHVKLDNVAATQIGLVIVIAQRVGVRLFRLIRHFRPTLPNLLIPARRLVPGVSYYSNQHSHVPETISPL